MLKVREVLSMDTDEELKVKGEPLRLRRNRIPKRRLGQCHCMIDCPNEAQRSELATFATAYDCSSPVPKDDGPELL
jgi:hypothetical protein